MGKPGSTLIQWVDYEGYFYLETTSEKLVETLAASGIRWYHKDEETGLYRYKLPTAWLRLRLEFEAKIHILPSKNPKSLEKSALYLEENSKIMRFLKIRSATLVIYTWILASPCGSIEVYSHPQGEVPCSSEGRSLSTKTAPGENTSRLWNLTA